MIDPPPPSFDEVLSVPWRCPRCREDLAPRTPICPACRAPFRLPQEAWFHDRTTVLSMLFLVAGPLAVPWLLKSPKFHRVEKAWWTFAVFGYTALLASGVWWLLVHAYRQITSVIK